MQVGAQRYLRSVGVNARLYWGVQVAIDFSLYLITSILAMLTLCLAQVLHFYFFLFYFQILSKFYILHVDFPALRSIFIFTKIE